MKIIYKIIFFSIIIILNSMVVSYNSNLFSENLREERLSRENAWYFGGSLLSAGKSVGELDIQSENELVWGGVGFSLDSLYVSGLYWSDKESEIFLSSNTSLGYINWNERYTWIKDDPDIINLRIDYENIDKGYSLYFLQRARFNMIVYNVFGIFFDAGLGFEYTIPKNLEIDEDIEREFKPVFQYGFGFYFIIPFNNPIIFEVGADFTSNIINKPVNYSDEIFILSLSMLFEFY